MRRWVLLGVILVAIGLGLSDLVKFSRSSKAPETLPAASAPQDTSDRIDSVSAPVEDLRNPAAQVRPTRPVEIAKLYLDEHRKELKLQPHHQFMPQESVNPLGSRVRFGVYQDGLPVLGMGIELMVKTTGEVQLLSSDYVPLHRWTGEEKDFVSMDTVAAKLRDSYELDTSSPPAKALVAVPASSEVEAVLVVSARKLGGSGTQTLLVRASDGQVLSKTVPRKEF